MIYLEACNTQMTHVEIELNKERNFTFTEEYAEEDLKNKLVLELNNETYGNELDNIEQQSPILERELQNTEYELENFKSRLAMTETVSAVTQSVLDSIRSEYNIEDNCPEVEAKESQLEEYFDENNQAPNSSNENIEHEYAAEEITGIIEDDHDDSNVEADTKETCDEINKETTDKKVSQLIQEFECKSLSQVDNNVTVQTPAANLIENIDPSSSAGENESFLTVDSRKLSISQTNLIDNADYSENDCLSTEENVTKSTDTFSNEKKQMNQNTKLYQTFDSSSSESETEQDNSQKKKSTKKVKIEGNDMPEIQYSSGEVSSESLQDLIESNKNYISDSSLIEEPPKAVDSSLEYGNFLSVSENKFVAGSESREFLLQDDDEESQKTKTLNESIKEIETDELIPSIVKRELSELSNKSIIQEFSKLEKQADSEIDASTDNESVYTSTHRPSFKHEQIESVTGIEATNLIISSSSTSCSSVIEKNYHQDHKEGSYDVSCEEHNSNDEKESAELLDSSIDELEAKIGAVNEISKSLNCLETLVVNSSSVEGSENIDITQENINEEVLRQLKNSQSLNLKKARPDSLKTNLSADINADYLIPSDDLYEEKTPTAGGFFDQQVTSSNEPSIDKLNMMDQSKEEITAIATAYLFSATIQSDYELNATESVAQTAQDNVVTSSNESIIVNEAYDDTEDQKMLRSKINSQVEVVDETEEFNIDEKTFLIATPTSSIQSPQVEKQINFRDSIETEMEQYSRNDHLEKIEQAISIVEHTLEKSFNIIADIVDENIQSNETTEEMVDTEENDQTSGVDQSVIQTINTIERNILENETKTEEEDEENKKVTANSIISSVIEKAKEICNQNEKSLTKIDSDKNMTFSESTEDLLVSSSDSSNDEIVKLSEESINLNAKEKIVEDNEHDLVPLEASSVVERAIQQAKTICESNEVAINKVESIEASSALDEEYQDIKNEAKAHVEEVNSLHEAIEAAKSICNDYAKSLTKVDSDKNMTFTESTEDLLISSSDSSNDEIVKLSEESKVENVIENSNEHDQNSRSHEESVQLEVKSVVENAIQQAKSICEENERALKGEIKNQIDRIIEQAQSICDEREKSNVTPPVSPMEITPSESDDSLMLRNSERTCFNEFVENILDVSRDKLESYTSNEQNEPSLVPSDMDSKHSDDHNDFTGVSKLSEKPDFELTDTPLVSELSTLAKEVENDDKLQNESKNMIEKVLLKAKEICEENEKVLILAESNDYVNNIIEQAQERLKLNEEVKNDSLASEVANEADSEHLKAESESFVTQLIDNAKKICEENEEKLKNIEALDLVEDSEDDEDNEKKKKKKKGNDDSNDLFKDGKKDSDDDDDDNDMNGGDFNKISILQQTASQPAKKEQNNSDTKQSSTTSTNKNTDQEVESPEQFNSMLNTQPMLTSSFMSESGNLPEPCKLLNSFDLCDQTLTIDEVENNTEDDEEDSSNRTIDLDLVTKQSNDTTNDPDASSCSFHTAIDSIHSHKTTAAISNLASKRSSTSNSYMTAQEEFTTRASFDGSNKSNDTFHTAIGDMSGSSRGLSSTYNSNNSYNTGSQSFNSTLADLSTDSFSLNDSNTNDELGQFNVQSFLNMYPNESKPKSDSSLNSTLTEDGSEPLKQKPLANESKVEFNKIDETESFDIISKEEASEDFVIAETQQDTNGEEEEDLTSANGSTDDISTKKNRMNLLLTPSASNSSSSSPSSTSSSMTKDLMKRQFNKVTESFSDNVSCTSSVLEFEKLEMQCSTESFEEKAQDFMKPRRSKNLELDPADEEESISCLNDDNDEYEQEADESLSLIRKNFEICHDLNTIYESFEKESVSDDMTHSSPRRDSISKSNENLLVNEPNIKIEDTSLKSSIQLAKSLSKISPNVLDDQKSNFNLELSRSSSSCSVKSNDSFENELKCKVRIDGASFFGKKNVLKKPSVPPPEVPTKQIETEKSSSLLTTEDSGQSSMTESVNSAFHSQLQSPNPDDPNTVNMCLIPQAPMIKSDYEKKNIDEKFINDLKKSMAKGQKSSKLPLSHSSSSSRQSRTSSSASSSSSTSLNDSSLRSTIHVLQSSQLNSKKSFQPHVSAESLPSFKKGCNSLQSEEILKNKTPNLVTSSSFNSNIETKANQESFKTKKANVSNPNISSHHSSNCYCGKHSPVTRPLSLNNKSMSSKSSSKGNV